MKRRAFTLVEMMVAMALATVLGLMVVQILDSSSRTARSNVANSLAQTSSREVVSDLSSALSAMELPASCVSSDSDSGWCISRRVSNTTPIVYQSGSCLIFYAHTGYSDQYDWPGEAIPSDGSTKAPSWVKSLRESTTVPDLVVAYVDAGSSTVSVSRFSGVADRDRAASHAGDFCRGDVPLGSLVRKSSVTGNLIEPSTSIFLSSDGTPLPEHKYDSSSPLPAPLDSITVNAAFQGRPTRSDTPIRFVVDFTVTIPSARYN